MIKPMIGHFCWNELATPDVKKSKEFYGKLFNWEFKELNMGEMTYTIIGSPNNEFAGIWEIPNDQRDQIPPHWMAYILVDNIETYLEKAKQLGAKIYKGPLQAGDMGRFAILGDTTGAHFALWESSSKM